MSSNPSRTQSDRPSTGTNSPPLEATGSAQPMGAASVNNPSLNAGYVSDGEQRKQYFQDYTSSSGEKIRSHSQGRSPNLKEEAQALQGDMKESQSQKME